MNPVANRAAETLRTTARMAFQALLSRDAISSRRASARG